MFLKEQNTLSNMMLLYSIIYSVKKCLSKNYILGDIFTIEERAKNNTFDILDEVKKIN